MEMFCVLVVVLVAGVYKFVDFIDAFKAILTKSIFKKHVLERHNAKEMD